MPRSINAPRDLRTVEGPLPMARTALIDCRLIPLSAIARINDLVQPNLMSSEKSASVY